MFGSFPAFPVFRSLSCSPACSFGTPPGEHPGKELSRIAMWHKAEANKQALLCLHCEQAGESEFEEGFKRQDVIN